MLGSADAVPKEKPLLVLESPAAADAVVVVGAVAVLEVAVTAAAGTVAVLLGFPRLKLNPLAGAVLGVAALVG